MDSKSKKIIEKLVKIAESQQKIINKLAQEVNGTAPPASWADAAAEVQPVVDAAAKAKNMAGKFNVESAQLGKDSGLLKVKLQYPMALLGTPAVREVTENVKAQLAGKSVAGGQVSKVEVIGIGV